MNAQEIKDIRWDEEKGIDVAAVPEIVKPLMQTIHSRWSKMSRNRGKSYNPRSIGMNFTNFIVGRLPTAPFLRDEVVEVAVKLENNIWCKRNIRMVCVNRVQDIPVPCDLLLGSVPWGGLLLYNSSDAVRRRGYSLDPIGGFGALDHGHLAKSFQDLRRLLFEQSFPALVLANQPYCPYQLVGHGLPFNEIRLKGLHGSLLHNAHF
jgi:hypothetical protein